jgi:hypothetical protein
MGLQGEFILPGVFHTTNMKNVVETTVPAGFFGSAKSIRSD